MVTFPASSIPEDTPQATDLMPGIAVGASGTHPENKVGQADRKVQTLLHQSQQILGARPVSSVAPQATKPTRGLTFQDAKNLTLIGSALYFYNHTARIAFDIAVITLPGKAVDRVAAKFAPNVTCSGKLTSSLIASIRAPGMFGTHVATTLTNSAINGFSGKPRPTLNNVVAITFLFAPLFAPLPFNQWTVSVVQYGLATYGPVAYLAGPAVALSLPYASKAISTVGQGVYYAVTHPAETHHVAADFFALLNGDAEEETVALAEAAIYQPLQNAASAVIQVAQSSQQAREIMADFFALLNGEAEEEAVALADAVMCQPLYNAARGIAMQVARPWQWLWQRASSTSAITCHSSVAPTAVLDPATKFHL